MKHVRQPVSMPRRRSTETMHARRQLQHRGWPRLQMALIVVLTGAAGFLASHLLRLAGLDAMLLRYPLAVLVAYGVFAGGLYRRMQGMQAQGWWRLCLSHTIWPLLGLLVFFAGLGWLAQAFAPDAVSLMQVFKAL